MPYFQRIALDAELVPLPADAFFDPPASATNAKSDAAPNQYPGLLGGDHPNWGQMYLANRLRSHPDVGYQHYQSLMPLVMKDFESQHPVEVERRKKMAEGA